VRLSISTTDKIVSLDGVQCREWDGVTDTGVRCTVYVHRVAAKEEADQGVFEDDLCPMDPPKEMEEPTPPQPE